MKHEVLWRSELKPYELDNITLQEPQELLLVFNAHPSQLSLKSSKFTSTLTKEWLNRYKSTARKTHNYQLKCASDKKECQICELNCGRCLGQKCTNSMHQPLRNAGNSKFQSCQKMDDAVNTIRFACANPGETYL